MFGLSFEVTMYILFTMLVLPMFLVVAVSFWMLPHKPKKKPAQPVADAAPSPDA